MRTSPVDGFRLAYDDVGSGTAVVALHGWPGDRRDYRLLVPLLADEARLVVPDLRGFGESDKHDVEPQGNYDAEAQARSIAGLIDELSLGPVLLVGYDVGSRVAQRLSRLRPDLVRAMVLAPPMPGVGDRVLRPEMQREFWYQAFHNLALSEQLIDGSAEAVRHYLAHFWQHWSGPDFELDEGEFAALVERYAEPGAFRASINWYRAGAGAVAQAAAQRPPSHRSTTPLTVLWPEYDPLFPREWSDRLDEWFADVRLRPVDGVGHFAPLEYPEVVADEVRAARAR